MCSTLGVQLDEVVSFCLSPQIITLAGITLNGSNLIGYIRCKRDARAKISAMAGRLIGRQIINQVSVHYT